MYFYSRFCFLYRSFCRKKAAIVRCSTINFNGTNFGERNFFGFFSETLLKKSLLHRCFHLNFTKFLRTSYLQNTSRRVLLYFQKMFQGSVRKSSLFRVKNVFIRFFMTEIFRMFSSAACLRKFE